ncbi:hypothetical protein Pla108_00560 [Botrimarina colliarenosi]|uniref:Endonuclease III n=1 Tax=Botrimarina colliarenosi TaxID=2528001 RepID=A0A5C6ALS3_9BACT|nr:hypothetical protein [Botrimarina colliarenosi]TWT99123.1 hypothetical protein Pla108_00560 [Botrimarina colliarenosi]
MAASNRASRLTKLVSDLKKRYKPAPPVQRPLFETILFATLLENSPPDIANKAFDELESAYFDWNEVRVSSRTELAERMKTLPDASPAADRLKRTLQSIFETVYKFDLEEFKKQNLGQAVKTITEFDGVTPFVVNYATQHGLAGHAIAVNSGALIALQVMDIITEAEAKKSLVPGLERAIPKSKGVEAQQLLHEMGLEVGRNPYGATAKKVLTELDPSCKDRLPKRPKVEEAPAPKKAPAEKTESPKAPPAEKKGATTAKAEPTKNSAPKKSEPKGKPAAESAAKKPAPAKTDAATKKKADPPKKPATKKAATKKAPTKKPATSTGKKKTATKKVAATKKTAKTAKSKTSAKKVAGKKAAKRKPK